MLALSTADHQHSPPEIVLPREYNAAYDLLQRNLSAGRGDKAAFIDDSGQISFAELERRSNRFAHLLGKRGVVREQRILLCMHDTIDFPTVFLGAIKAGVIPVAVNTLLTAKDYEYMLSDSIAQIAVISAPLLPLFAPLAEKLSIQLWVAGAINSDENHNALIKSLSADLVELPAASETFSVVNTLADSPCFWLYSSGSTGAPKGTVHVHSSMMQTAELYAKPILGIKQQDVVFSAAKLFFAYGLGNSLSFPMAVGATAILMEERPTPAAVFARLIQHRPSIFYGVPTLYAAMLASSDLPEKKALALRRCASAGEPLPEEIGKRWSQHFGVDILDGIGSTEMLHIYISNRPGEVRYGTTGKPVPGYQLRIVDDEGNPVAPGQSGELQINGPSAAMCYWHKREKTRNTFLGQWTRSGDKYSETPDGYFVYAGRSDDMLKVSGIYVSPIEVEATLITHPAVLEAAVIGRADIDQLIKPMAYIVLKPGQLASNELKETLKQHIKDNLAPFKYPRWFEFVDELPKTATGKIQRYKLRAQHAID